MKIILLGSPKIAIETFKVIIQNFDVVAIITQPDRKKGRGMQLHSTPVSKLAHQFNIPVYKPIKISQIYGELQKIDFDILLSFAYGQIIPNNILNLGRYKPMNIHGSLLPKYRGAAPIQYAILNNDKEIGISLIEMIDKMDAGDIYFQSSQCISEKIASKEAFDIISKLAQKNIVSWLKKIERNEVFPRKQGNDFTLSPKISKDFSLLLETDSKEFNMRKIKALNPFPGCHLFKDKKRIKIFNASFESIKTHFTIKCNDGFLFPTEFQIEGKKITKL